MIKGNHVIFDPVYYFILCGYLPPQKQSKLKEQAGTGPSRRHIQGSKIAKGHQSFKVFSSTALKIFKKKSHNAEKN